MSDTEQWGMHEVYRVAPSREFVESHPDSEKEDIIAAKCEKCDLRSEGHHRAVSGLFYDRTCPPGLPKKEREIELPNGRTATVKFSGIAAREDADDE